eukprot:SAG31_NODE_3486_length_4210_cov_1.754074_4_plen_92_part_00
MSTIVSQRVERENQCKCQAAMLLVQTMFGIAGAPFFSSALYDSVAISEKTWQCLLPAGFAAVSTLISTIFTVWIAALARRTSPVRQLSCLS